MTVGVLLLLVLTVGTATLTVTAVRKNSDGIGGIAWSDGKVQRVFIAGPNSSCPWLASVAYVNKPTRTNVEICIRALPVDLQDFSRMKSPGDSSNNKSSSMINSTQEETSANDTMTPSDYTHVSDGGVYNDARTPSDNTHLSDGGVYNDTMTPSDYTHLSDGGVYNGIEIPSGYTQLSGGGIYKVHEEKMTWHEAKATCEAEGAHLVIVDSKEEAAAIRTHLEWHRSWWRERPFTLHAGFAMEFRTPNGWPLSSLGYERWAPKQPAAPICGRIDHDVWLLFGPCSQDERFVCEYEQKTHEPSSRSTFHIPPEKTYWPLILPIMKHGYTQFSGKWYKHLDMTVGVFFGNPWEDAHRACKRDGANLAVLESPTEAEAVVNFFQSLPENVPRRDTLLALRTSVPVDIFGNPVSASSYHLWAEKIVPNSCLCIDIKAMFRTCSCEDVSLSFLCKYAQADF